MSYTELDYLQEEVLGYFTEDKSDIKRDIAEKRRDELENHQHLGDYRSKKSKRVRERDKNSKKIMGKLIHQQDL